MVIIPGETVTCTFLVPYAKSALSKAVVTFYQNGKTVIEKQISKTANTFVIVDDSHTNIVADLNQLDTLRIGDYAQCDIQINIITTNGARLVGKPITVNVAYQHYRKIII